jgi:[ribosomal protein S5]-alanine N-acetyltransferase
MQALSTASMETRTQRLMLTPLREEDARDLHQIRGDPEVMKFWDWPHDETLAVTESIVTTYLRAMDAGREFFWTVRLRSDGSFVGICDLGELSAEKSAEAGFMLARRVWGRGLGREAVMGLVETARDMGLKLLWARVHSDNERSVRLLLRVGFTELAPLPNFEIRPGIRRDCRRFELQLAERQEEQPCQL